MTSIIDGGAGVRVERDHYESLFLKLCPSPRLDGVARKDAFFPYMYNLFAWGALLGYSNHGCEPLSSVVPRETPFKWETMPEGLKEKLVSLALVDILGGKDIIPNEIRNLLASMDQSVRDNIEGHANWGFREMIRQMSINRDAYSSYDWLVMKIIEITSAN